MKKSKENSNIACMKKSKEKSKVCNFLEIWKYY